MLFPHEVTGVSGRLCMRRFAASLEVFLREDSGQDLIEYALLATFVALVAIGGATVLGIALNNWFADTANDANVAAATAS